MKKKKTVPELFEDRTGVPYENWIQGMIITHNQEKTRMKKNPKPTKDNMFKWIAPMGYKFWAKDLDDAILYCKHMEWAFDTLKKVEEDVDANVDG